nr:IclR family transcriptional regulator [uncultured Lachnoanaerobaculum sp.]
MKINRTTERSVQILQIIAKSNEGLEMDEICERLSIPRTSCYDILVTLVHLGMLEVNTGVKRSYKIGLNAYRIGMSYMNNRNISEIIAPALKELSKELQKTCFFGVLEGDKIVYISKFEPENPIITTATIGTKNPIYNTSLGKAILSSMSAEEIKGILSGIELKQATRFTITDREELIKNIELVRVRGFALDERELEEHMECVGVPIFDEKKECIGAISASSLYRKDEDYMALGEILKNRGLEISKSLGFMP